jgi:hypothetical protein
MRSDPLLQLRGIGLDPAEDRGVSHRDAAVGQHQLEIAIADRNIRYQRTAQRITSAVNCRPLNDLSCFTVFVRCCLAIGGFYPSKTDPKSCNRTARADQMRLGLSTRGVGYHIAAWRHPDVAPGAAESLAFFLENARLAEAGRFDFLFLADGLGIRARDNPSGSLSHSNENVELEPLTLLSAVAALTTRVGLVATASTSYDEPFQGSPHRLLKIAR